LQNLNVFSYSAIQTQMCNKLSVSVPIADHAM